MTKNKRKVSLLAIVLLLLVTTGVIAFTYSRYSSEAKGTSNAQIAKWTVKVNNADITKSSTITATASDFDGGAFVETGKIAPGSKANIPIKIDGTGAEVSFKYTVEVSNIRANVTNSRIIVKTATTGGAGQWTLKSPGVYEYTGEMNLADVDKVKTLTIPVEWTLVDNTSANTEDVATANAADPSVTMDIKVKAEQKL